VQETGVSIMNLGEGMDDGPVYAQQKLKLNGNESKLELSKKLHEDGVSLLLDNLESILEGSLQPIPQDSSQATYTKQLKKEDGQIDWNESAEVIERKVRAFAGFPKSRTELFGHNVVIIKASVAMSADDGDLVMKCGDDFVEIQELIAPSGRNMNGADFIRGYKK
jgi:methionyl-tRNA formyltransferase